MSNGNIRGRRARTRAQTQAQNQIAQEPTPPRNDPFLDSIRAGSPTSDRMNGFNSPSATEYPDEYSVADDELNIRLARGSRITENIREDLDASVRENSLYGWTASNHPDDDIQDDSLDESHYRNPRMGHTYYRRTATYAAERSGPDVMVDGITRLIREQGRSIQRMREDNKTDEILSLLNDQSQELSKAYIKIEALERKFERLEKMLSL